VSPTPPRGLRWLDAPLGRVIALGLAVVSIAVSLYVGSLYVGLIDCLREQAGADALRTSAIAEATDRERRADLALLAGTGSRQQSIDARQFTDQVRAENPAPSTVPC
jgi:hypothetical protein